MGGAKPRTSAEATTRPKPPHRAHLHCHSCPFPSFLPLSVIPAQAGTQRAQRHRRRPPQHRLTPSAYITNPLSKLHPSPAIPTHLTPSPHPFPNSSLPPSRGEVRWWVRSPEQAQKQLRAPNRHIAHTSTVIPAPLRHSCAGRNPRGGCNGFAHNLKHSATLLHNAGGPSRVGACM